MSTLIKQAKIIDPSSPHKGKKVDILIERGVIQRIGSTVKSAKATKFAAANLHVSAGWFDMHANFCDPGYEHKEDLESGARAAAFGGFTGVALVPSTTPSIDSKSDVEYIGKITRNSLIDIHPMGALSGKLEGETMSEMYDMHLSGAVAFTDDKHSVSNAGFLQRALLYSKGFNGLVINFPNDPNIQHNGMINEGAATAALGIKVIPSLAEELMVARDLGLLEYTDSKLHLATISTARSVELIRQAKAKGLQVTCEVAAHQIMLEDKELDSFDSNYKVMPPLRAATDIRALIKGLKDGTIDAICSDHNPEDEENKKREFEHAAFGIIGLETAFAAANTSLKGHLTINQLVEKLAIRPREILNLKVPVIKEGETANLTLFDPNKKWTFQESDIYSKSRNTPFIGTEFTGKALAIYHKSKLVKC